MAEKKSRRVYAGYYNRYDGNLIYVARVVTDIDTGEEISTMSGRRFKTLCNIKILISLWQSICGDSVLKIKNIFHRNSLRLRFFDMHLVVLFAGRLPPFFVVYCIQISISGS